MRINRLLVANRGEIARRVFATCRRLGIGTVAVHSDADAGLQFVAEADFAVRLPGNAPVETYLRADLILDAARRSGADAVHPGYGFLSESADFARAVIDAGLTWVGPTAESIEAMGSKVAAKKTVAAAGVPVLAELDAAAVTAADLPLLVKASAGGGGRGMRVVRDLDDVHTRVTQAADEAASAFDDATVFCEPYVEHGRHVEVQVVGDSTGRIVVLGERDCSLQRRHQKVLEETPAPGLSESTRRSLHEAAGAVAAAVGYVGAGTVEFLMDGDRFFFLEMNTRLQVEHPVTEAVFGVDLVELQIRVAEGESLDVAEPVSSRGHAVEVRLYAEDPAVDWQPQSGVLELFEVPGVRAEFDQLSAYGVRLDAGYVTGNRVSTFYDAMLAKLVAWGPDRPTAFRTLAGVLERARIHGLVTNRDLLVNLLKDPAVLRGEVSTELLERRPELRTVRIGDLDVAAFAGAIAFAEQQKANRRVQRGLPVAWRNVVSAPQRTVFRHGDDELTVDWYADRAGYRHTTRDDISVVQAGPSRVLLEVGGVRSYWDVTRGAQRGLTVDGPHWSVRLQQVPRFVDPAAQVGAGSLLAPMPGTVVSVAVSTGDRVRRGQTMLVLEAMKMQHTVAAPADGVVTQIGALPGAQVAAAQVLAVVATESDQTTGLEESTTREGNR
ncbi:MAG: ATP-grasp domain-containing protein [Actinomycetota bacterium]|nr:ATP-grasp domain-containing protein [Actinomycetota bacterium]